MPKKNLLFLMIVLVLSGPLLAQLPNLKLSSSVDPSKVDLNWLFSRIHPKFMEINSIVETPEINFVFDPNMFGASSCNNTIYFPAYPQNKYNLSDLLNIGLVHEWVHVWQPCNAFSDSGLAEGFADGEKNIIYRKLHNEDSRIEPATAIFMQDILNNLPIEAAFSKWGLYFYPNKQYSYAASAGLIELLYNRADFKKVTAALLQGNPQSKNEAFRIIEQTVPTKINGVSATTFLNYNLGRFRGGTDGTFFALYPVDGLATWQGSITQTPVNPMYVLPILFRRSGDLAEGISGRIRYEVKDARGTVVKSGESKIDSLTTTIFFDQSFIKNLPEGAYSVTGYPLRNDSSCCTAKPDTTFFPIYRKGWQRGKTFIILNGRQWGDFSQVIPTLTSSTSDRLSVEAFPGLMVITGAKDDITLTDGNRTRTFTPDWDVSTVYLWMRRDKPYLRTITSAASFKTSEKLVPGSIYTMFANFATHTDPETTVTLPLPTSSCDKGGQGETQVVVTYEDGSTAKAPVFYCSQEQINFQMPTTVGHSKAKIQTDLNGTRSNSIELPVAQTDPDLFVAVHQNSTAINGDSPAYSGEIVSLYVTGLGETNPRLPESGYPAPANSQYKTVLPVRVTLGDLNCEVLFSGLAPGLTGLYQINIKVPSAVTAGKHSLTVYVGSDKSNEVALFVQ